jgi:hypothetical protein
MMFAEIVCALRQNGPSAVQLRWSEVVKDLADNPTLQGATWNMEAGKAG